MLCPLGKTTVVGFSPRVFDLPSHRFLARLVVFRMSSLLCRRPYIHQNAVSYPYNVNATTAPISICCQVRYYCCSSQGSWISRTLGKISQQTV